MKQSDYWDSFYSAWEMNPPSQFAALVLSEFIVKESVIFDLGCGNGRDSRFFSLYGCQVEASDGSMEAISRLETESKLSTKLNYAVVDYGDSSTFLQYLESRRSGSLKSLYYARFLLHALNDETLATFIETIKKASKSGDVIAAEFRTKKDDRLGGKVTPIHFRRGLDLHEVLAEFDRDRYRVILSEEGFGYARYQTDDAHVARLILVVL
jgi:tellurite methyltransferase